MVKLFVKTRKQICDLDIRGKDERTMHKIEFNLTQRSSITFLGIILQSFRDQMNLRGEECNDLENY